MSVSQFGDNIIDNYIQRLSTLNQERPQVISQEELEALALDIGIAPDVLDRAHTLAQSSFEAGLRHQADQNWAAAIAAFEQSVSLQPCDPESLYQLAAAHHSRYRATRNLADAERANALVQECLTHAPDHAAATTLRKALQVPLAPQSPQSQIETPSSSSKQIFITAIAILGGGLLLLLAFISETKLADDFPRTSGSAEAENRIDPITPPSDRPPGTRIDLPIEVADSLSSLGANLSFRQSRLSIYSSGDSYYSLEGLLVNDSTQEFKEFQLTLAFKDGNDAVLEEVSLRGVSGLDPALRPGDSAPVSTTRKVDPRATTVELSLQSIDSAPAATTYDPGREIPVVWDIPQPSHFALQALERQFSIRTSLRDEDFVLGTFALTNTGDAVFEKLVLEFRAYDAADTILSSRSLHIAGLDPDLWQTETRLENVRMSFPTGLFHRYELVVIEAE